MTSTSQHLTQESLTEFTLIDAYFNHRQAQRSDVVLALGDDCALLQVPQGHVLAVSTDSLVAGTHFLADANPAWVAHKALTSNLSDLAAMGATPAWVSMALTLPQLDRAWLDPFCHTFFQLADQVGIQLIGGDTTKGPLSITLTVHGFIPTQQALRRNGAQVGDLIYVSGTLGDSKAGLEVILQPQQRKHACSEELERRHYLKTARLALGEALRNYATSAIDISDGLVADLTHILSQSAVSAAIDVSLLPLSSELERYCSDKEKSIDKERCMDKEIEKSSDIKVHSYPFHQDLTLAQYYALTSGEEYELCFTIPALQQQLIESLSAKLGIKISGIGEIKSSPMLASPILSSLTITSPTLKHTPVLDLHCAGKPLNRELVEGLNGYDHFKGA